jgi:hypothetical protein
VLHFTRLFWIVATALTCAAAHAEDSVYRALVDGRINVLVTVASKDGQSTGTVVYDATGADGLSLVGRTDASGAFEWREMLESPPGQEPRASHVGTYRGRFGADGATGEGRWSTADGKRQAALILTRIARMTSLQATDVDASVSYPQLAGAGYEALNREVAAAANERLAAHAAAVREMRDELKDDLGPELLAALAQSTSCGIESASAELVSLLCTTYVFSGGAHGNSAYAAENYVRQGDGPFRQVGLWDVLKKSPQAAKQLSGLILRELRRKQASSVVDGGVTDLSREVAADAIPFTLVPAGIAFHFEPYAVGSFAEGGYRAVVPNRALAGLLRTDGPLAARAAGR